MTDREGLSSEEMIRMAKAELDLPGTAPTEPQVPVPTERRAAARPRTVAEILADPEAAELPTEVTSRTPERRTPTLLRPEDRAETTEGRAIRTQAPGRRGIAALVQIVAVALVGILFLGLFATEEETPAPAIEPVAVAANATGVCFNGLDPGTLEIAGTVDCAEPHQYELIGSVVLPDGDYPGAEALADEAFSTCLFLFEDYVGRGYDTSIWWLETMTPTETLWSDGERTANCLVFQYAAEDEILTVTGSAQGDGR